MRIIDYDKNEPFEINPDAIESVEPYVVAGEPEEGKTTGVVVLTMASGRQHKVVVDVWDAPMLEVESNDILDAWAALVVSEEEWPVHEGIPARTFRDRIVRKG